MPIHPDLFARTLLRQIDGKIRGLELSVLSGVAADYTAYRAMVGELRGLEASRQIIVDSLGEEADPHLKQRLRQ